MPLTHSRPESTMEPLPISPRLHDFVSETFRIGMSLCAGSDTLYPLVTTMDAGIMRQQAVVDPQRKQHLSLAEQYIAGLPPDVTMYAYLRRDQVRIDGQRADVLIVEAEERGMDRSVRFLQQFAPRGFLRRFRVVTNPYQSGSGKRRFSEAL